MRFIFLLMTTVMLFSLPTFARAKGNGNGPCKQVREACQAAGYYKGGWKEGKGLWKNCVNVILEGGVVAGVPQFDQSQLVACKEKRAQRKIRKMGRRQ